MYEKVLVPLDQTGDSETILEGLPDLVAPDGNALLLTVVAPGRTRSLGEVVLLGSQQQEEDTQNAMSYLKRVAKRVARKLKEKSVESTCWVTVGASPAAGIVGFANQQDVALISMYTHGRKGLAKLIRGSVAREAERRAQCPVLVLGPNDSPGAPINITHADEESAASHDYSYVDLFRNLSAEQISAVVALGRRLKISAGQTLGVGGERGQKLFLILDGEARLTAHAEIGEIAVRIAGPEESFPLAVLLGEGILITAGEALTDMELLELPRLPLLDLFSQDHQIGIGIYAAVAQLFATRYDATLTHLGISAARELCGETPWYLRG